MTDFTDPTAQPTPRKALVCVTDEATLGICAQLDYDLGYVSTVVEVAPPEGLFEVLGVRSFNGPFDVKVESLQDARGVERSGGPFDSASYALHGPVPAYADPSEPLAYYPAPWGVISREHPLRIRFVAYGTPTVASPLQWTLYGRVVSEVVTPEVVWVRGGMRGIHSWTATLGEMVLIVHIHAYWAWGWAVHGRGMELAKGVVDVSFLQKGSAGWDYKPMDVEPGVEQAQARCEIVARALVAHGI